jgi:hypothetical protein
MGILFPGFVLFHDGFQLIEPVLPQFPEGFNKVGYFFYLFGIQVIVNLPAVLLRLKQFALGEYLQVFGNGGSGGVKVGGDGPSGHGLRSNQQEDGPSGWVGDGLKNVSS